MAKAILEFDLTKGNDRYSFGELDAVKKKQKKVLASADIGAPCSKTNVFLGFNFEELPELTMEQLKSFKPITAENRERLKKALANGRVIDKKTDKMPS